MFTSQTSILDLCVEHWETFAIIGLSLFVLTVALFRFSLFTISKIFEAICDWLDYVAARRKRQQCFRRRWRQTQPGTEMSVMSKWDLRTDAPKNEPKKVSNVISYQTRRPLDAREALRRNVEGAVNHSEH